MKVFKVLKAFGKKDISKLVKKQIIDKRGKRTTVYVKVSDYKHSVWDKIAAFFKTAKESALGKLKMEYATFEVESKFNISFDEWELHVVEYFRHPEYWNSKLDGKKTKPKGGTKGKGRGKGTGGGKGGGPREYKYRTDVMKFVRELYFGGREYEEPEAEKFDIKKQERKQKAESGAHPSVHDTDGRNADAYKRHTYRKSTEKQPYASDGILVSREEVNQRPKADFISSDIRGALKQHQQDFVNLAMEQYKNGVPAMVNADGTGAGKTREELALAQTYIEQMKKPVLILTENIRIFDNAFKKDAEAMGLKINLLATDEDIKKVDPKKPGIYVTLYSRLSKYKNDFNKFGLAVYDESHNLKNFDSTKARLGNELMETVPHKAFFSATPIDKAEHLWYISRAYGLHHTRLMEALGFQLQSRTFGRQVKWIYVAREDKDEIASRINSLFDDMTKKGLMNKREVSMDNLDINIRRIKLTPEFIKKYDDAYANWLRELEMTPPHKRGLMKAVGLLRMRRILEEGKIDQTTEKIIEETTKGKHVVVFATRINESEIKKPGKINAMGESEAESEISIGSLKEISKRLKDMGIEHGRVFGGNPEIPELIKQFQAGQMRVILTTPQSGGTGINLDDATGDSPRKGFIMTPPFSAMEFIQMAGRINRLTTKSRAEMEMITTDTQIDQWNKDIIATKMSRLGATVAGDYGKIDIDDMNKIAYMSEEDAQEYLKDKKAHPEKYRKIEQRNIKFDDFISAIAQTDTTTGSYAELTRPLRTIIEYETFIPVKEKGVPDFTKPWPDAEIGFGKYKGMSLSKLKYYYPDYVKWFLNQTKSGGLNLGDQLDNIKFGDDTQKAMRFIVGNTILKARIVR